MWYKVNSESCDPISEPKLRYSHPKRNLPLSLLTSSPSHWFTFHIFSLLTVCSIHLNISQSTLFTAPASSTPSLSNSLSVHDNVLDPLSHSGFLTTLATAFQSTIRRCKLQARVIMSQAVPGCPRLPQAVPGLLSTGHLLEATWCCAAKLVLPRKGRNEPDVDAKVSFVTKLSWGEC